MRKIRFSEILPFVRFVRTIGVDIGKFPSTICAYDARLFYCTEGYGVIRVEETDYEMSPGALLLFGAGVPYRYLLGSEGSMRLLGINFDFNTEKNASPLMFPPERIEDFDKERLGEVLSFSDAEIFNRPLHIKNANELYPKLSEIKKEYERKKLYFEQRCAGLMLSLLGEIAKPDEKDAGDGTEKVINSVIRYLRENYAEDISNKSLGKAFGYHPNYLNRIFIKYTGKPLYRYLQDIRIMQALRMLENTELPISEVARLSGFCDVPHFSRYFKQKTGYSPRNFRI